jgi:tripartite-type tricarboxylate transporter receptor subunit TctC
MNMKTILALVLVVLAVVWPAAPAPAQSAPNYAGKTVTIIVGYPPGGGYDVISRMVARHLGRFLPGNPAVIVQNMPGANSIIAANHVYNVAKPDGLTLGAFNRNLILGQLVRVDGIKFDMAKFGWVGSPASETTILAIRTDLPYRTAQDLRRADPPVVVGATGPGASTYDFPLLLKAFAGMNLRIISGYPSSSEIMLAIERKEADGRSGSYSSIKPFIDRGLVRPVVRGIASVPVIERLPVDEDLTTDPRGKAVMRLRSIPEVVGRPFVMPPGTPPEYVHAMSEAFRKMTADRAFETEAERAGFEIRYTPGDQTLKIMREVLNAPSDVVRVFSQFFKFE